MRGKPVEIALRLAMEVLLLLLRRDAFNADFCFNLRGGFSASFHAETLKRFLLRSTSSVPLVFFVQLMHLALLFRRIPESLKALHHYRLERVCLNIQHPVYVLIGVGLAVAIVMILPMMYCCVFCCARGDCCELGVTEPQSHDYYIGMENLKRDVVQLMQRDDHAAQTMLANFATISGFSSDTVRGAQYLAASTTAASITFCLLAAMNQTIQTTDRPEWISALTGSLHRQSTMREMQQN